MFRVIIGFLISALLPLCNASAADDVYQVIVKRQEQKKASRWTLSEWLETRDRMRLMDMWLAIHTPSPYEFYLGGNYQFASADGAPYTGGQFQIAAYATIFGLEYQNERSDTRITNILFHMRLLGLHAQSTNITLEGGVRFRGEDSEFRSAVAGVDTTIYLTKYFGLEGLYRHIFDSSTNEQGYRIEGNRYEIGAFIDFNFLRIYGTYFHEQETANAAQYQQYFPIRKGGMAGVKLFF
jgi:hypothetical protein